MGHEHVKTVHGAVDPSFFYRLSDHDRFELRKKLRVPTDDFVIGFVFRNQLRKSVPNLLEGYKLFKQKNLKGKKTKLLLHTHFGEGWNIMRLVKENLSLINFQIAIMLDDKMITTGLNDCQIYFLNI